MPDLLTDLNPQQRAAVEHADGPLLVVAGPGTGKTRVITHRIAHRVARGTPPERVLGITFTNRAAAEMQVRVVALLGDVEGVRLGTFHWMCHALLRRYAYRIGYARDFRLLSPAEARNAIKRAVLETWPSEQYAVGRIAAAVGAVKNGAARGISARRYRVAPEAIDVILRAYAAALKAARALDLDDLLFLSARLLREDEQTREACRAWYREVVVDEFQDTNPVQQELLSLLAPPHGSIVAVGDEDQAIYGWRQADSRGMHRFLDDFPSADVVRLTESYRSTKEILRAAGSLISHNPERIGAELRTPNPAGERAICIAADDEIDEAEQVACEIDRLINRDGLHAAEIAILYRVNAQSRALEDALVRHRIPYHVHAGTRFYERAEIRRVVGYLQLVLGDDDEAAAQLAAEVPGIGPRRLEILRDSAEAAGATLLGRFGVPLPGLPARAAERLRAIALSVETLRSMRNASLPALVSAAIDLAQTGDVALSGDADSAVENLDELRTIAREQSARHSTLRDFVDRLTFTSGESGRGGVSLMTLHASKGLEFLVVFLAGVEDGLLPHRRSLERGEDIEEERRLCYVGMTRARSRLYLSYTHARTLAGLPTLGGSSRFIGEIGGANLQLRVSPRRGARPRLQSAHIGERVEHPRWGLGTVTAVEGAGRDTLVTIRFDEAGLQRLQLCHAPLSRVHGNEVDVVAG